MYCFEKGQSKCQQSRRGFSLPEVMGALIILALVSSSVVVVIHRSVCTATDLTLRTRAFEVARNNMEEILTFRSSKETVEYGTSELYPDIAWQTIVETFNEPLTSQMWVRAVCSAEYSDAKGQTQTIELTHWLTRLTDKQVKQIAQQNKQREEELAGQIVETIEEAAAYAGVDVETIEQWVENGMLSTGSGGFITYELELYKQAGGAPTAEDKLFARRLYSNVMKRVADQQKDAEQPGYDEPKPKQEERPDWLPDNWDDMTREEKLAWLLSTLKW